MRRVAFLFLSAALPSFLASGCPTREALPEARRPTQKPAPPPQPLERRSLTLQVGIWELVFNVGDPPPFPKFRDPGPLPARSLRKERELSFRAEDKERQAILTDMAARLWALANAKIDRVRALTEDRRTKVAAATAAKIAALRREASAHLQECVALLEGVLETPRPPRLARLRLAHYLRELKPRAALSHYRALLVDEPEGPGKEALGVDLAQLLLVGQEPFGASEVFHKVVKTVSTARGRLLRALAHAATLDVNREEAVMAALSDCDGSVTDRSRASALHVPVLLASLRRPAGVFEHLVAKSSRCLQGMGATVGSHMVERLLGLGRASAARSVVRVMNRSSLELAAGLALRVAQEAGPFPRSEAPPSDRVLTRLLSGHVGAVLACAGRSVPETGVRLVVRVLQGGQVGLVFPPGAAGPGPEVTPGPPSVAGQDLAPLWRCLAELVPRWRLPPWRASVNLELTLTVRITRSDQRQSPETDPD